MKTRLANWSTRRNLAWQWALSVCVLCLLTPCAPAESGADERLQTVHTIYVDSFGAGANAQAARKRVVDRLEKGGIHVSDKSDGADALLHGNAVIWMTGTISNNLRSNSSRQTMYQGYLSVELTDSAKRTLWSYLATPGRFRTSNIVDDLADQVVARLEREMKTGMAIASLPAKATPEPGVALHGGGSTFPAPIYLKWFESFQQTAGGFPISYDTIGSEAGLERLRNGNLDFAASDIRPVESAQSETTYFPTVVGGIVPIYNLPDAGHTLNLTPQVLADIYIGVIRKWNDPRIRESNSGARLPDADIAVVHRSDGSGTTYAWTSYLASVSPGWKSKVGEGARVKWPVGSGVEGNEGVAEMVAKTPNSIGYVEMTYAIQHRLNYAAVRNPAGRFIKADLASITAAAAKSHVTAENLRPSLLDSEEKDAYPISSFTWIVVPKTESDAQKRAAIAGFLRWMLSIGQKQCSSLGYVPLPREVVAQELQAVDALK
ncbi:phosphate ABC transporter substrate-binding protein PstS [Alloacidobacterium dinghuense]|uniref:Phosphate-binding protein PstS n=1 Tax=Alloacidobacterium dinghuense TaxID=2763107 RepID=A0A7G8BJ24_9BACT|nr:phosphate ABC transporter substrate-binding protein PstS [Alloacidobacterium dinghuense]QNI32544.1 phosphate ABC transporter substrate-binding protein PstS [Alloacidobacterium dinghuense]